LNGRDMDPPRSPAMAVDRSAIDRRSEANHEQPTPARPTSPTLATRWGLIRRPVLSSGQEEVAPGFSSGRVFVSYGCRAAAEVASVSWRRRGQTDIRGLDTAGRAVRLERFCLSRGRAWQRKSLLLIDPSASLLHALPRPGPPPGGLGGWSCCFGVTRGWPATSTSRPARGRSRRSR
jgi:hypothetical protein